MKGLCPLSSPKIGRHWSDGTCTYSLTASCIVLGWAEDNNACDCGNTDFSLLLFPQKVISGRLVGFLGH